MWSPDDVGANPRADWMALLARANVDELLAGLGDDAMREPTWLRMPQTGLTMVRGRIGGDGAAFNLGESTVTRCALRLRFDASDDARAIAADASPLSPVGVAWVLGRAPRKARLAAIADALLQMPMHHARLSGSLLTPVRARLRDEIREAAERAHATRVEFFTVAREAGAATESTS